MAGKTKPRMTDFRRKLLRLLADAEGGWLYAFALADGLWPDRKWHPSPYGGPDPGAKAASWQCGRLWHATGWVDMHIGPGTPPSAWEITPDGRKALAEAEKDR